MADLSTPLSGIEAGSEMLAPAPFRRLLTLRGDAGAAGFLDAVQSAAGVTPPVEPNTVAVGEDCVCFWLGPDEWLLSAPADRGAALEAALSDAFADDPWAAVVDVSHTLVGLTISGPHAKDVLARGCALDLDETRFPVSACARTLLAQAGVLLRRLDDAPSFEIWIRISYADYVKAWLARAEASVLAASRQ